MSRFLPVRSSTFIAIALATAVAGIAVVTPHWRERRGARDDRRAWNFVVIVVDTLRYDATSMAGTTNTPFIQTLARRGVSFSRAFSTHDATPPSHFSLLTGLREGLGSPNDRPDTSLPYQLRQRGYSTFGVAANGNLSQKWMQSLGGFSQYACLYDDWIAMTAEARGRKLPSINAHLRSYGARETEWNQIQLFSSGQEVLARLRPMITSASEPFFGFINIIEPHDPYLPSQQSLGKEPASARTVDPDLRFRKPRYPLADPTLLPDPLGREYIKSRLATAGGRIWSLSDDLTPVDLETYRRRYAASVRDADAVVRSIFRELETRHVLDRTWVVIVSDHGESFGERGFLTHSLADKGDPEASYHVPMVWAPPKAFGTGMTIDEDVSLTDVAPTLYELAGIDWSPLKRRTSGEFGRSLLPDLAVAAGPATAEAELGSSVSDAERQRMQQDALDRLRALGYIK